MIAWGGAWVLVTGLRRIVRLLPRLGRGLHRGQAKQPFFPDGDLGPRPAVRPRHPAGTLSSRTGSPRPSGARIAHGAQDRSGPSGEEAPHAPE